jgi:hypothetical protein
VSEGTKPFGVHDLPADFNAMKAENAMLHNAIQGVQRDIERLIPEATAQTAELARLRDEVEWLRKHANAQAVAASLAFDETVQLRAEVEALRADAGRYRWLCGNNFDKPGVRQIHTWLHIWEPHSQTGEPTEWTQRLRGSSLDAAIDAAIAKAEAGNG